MDCPLHPRAVEAIKWLSLGKTHDEIARIMNVKKMTVYRHLMRSKDATGSYTTVALVSAAIRNGWVQ